MSTKLEVQISKTQLLNEVKVANRVIDKKPTLKVSEAIILEFTDNSLVLKATDGVNYFTKTIPSNNSINETFGVNRDLFHATLNAVNKEQITLVKEDNKVSIIAVNDKNEVVFNSFVFALEQDIVDTFPVFPNTSLNNYLTMTSKSLKNILDKTFCFDKQGATEALKGVNVNKNGSVIKFISSDRHRLSKVEEQEFDTNMDNFSVIIYNSLVQEIKRTESETVTLKFADKNEYVVLISDDREITYPLIQAQFPDVSKLFPVSFQQSIKVKTSELKNVVDSVSYIATKNPSNLCKLSIDGTVQVIAANSEVGFINPTLENVEIENDQQFVINLNNAFIKEAINSFKEDEITLGFTSGLITIWNEKDGKYRHLVMGLRNIG